MFRNTQYATMWLPLHSRVQYSVFYQLFLLFYLLAYSLQEFLKTRFTKCAQIRFILVISACTPTIQYRMVHFSYFCSFQSFPPTLDHLTQNWVQFIHFSSVEAQLPDSAVFRMLESIGPLWGEL